MAKSKRISERLLDPELKEKIDKVITDVYTKGEVDAIVSLPNTEFLDGGSFLDTYSSQTATVDGGEF